MLPENAGQHRVLWRSPLADTLGDILARRARATTVVLASGDPLWYGVGRFVLRHIPVDEVTILPHVSAFQEACSRLGWALEEVQALSAHGRPLERLCRHLRPGARLLVLTDDGSGPVEAAALLRESGYGDSRIWVLEELGGPGERVSVTTASELAGTGTRYADLNLLALDLAADPGIAVPAPVPGLADAFYRHDGQLTKAEVRAVTLAALAPLEGELLWDVGAGAGSVAIEWLRAGRAMRAVAIERDPVRAERIADNARRLGVPELEPCRGEAPGCLDGLPEPDAIFVGGGISIPGLLDRCWSSLAAGGRLVANAVTVRGEAALLAFHAEHGGRLLRLALSRAETVGGQLVWRPAVPVTQLATRKPCVAASS
jgi:precorrin-6Y C5,15-methyltransferase (decarboxylating)